MERLIGRRDVRRGPLPASPRFGQNVFLPMSWWSPCSSCHFSDRTRMNCPSGAAADFQNAHVLLQRVENRRGDDAGAVDDRQRRSGLEMHVASRRRVDLDAAVIAGRETRPRRCRSRCRPRAMTELKTAFVNFGEASTRIFIASAGVVMITISSGLIPAAPIAPASSPHRRRGQRHRACRPRRSASRRSTIQPAR